MEEMDSQLDKIRDEVDAFASLHGVPREMYHFDDSQLDGVHINYQNGYWCVSWFSNGELVEEMKFQDLSKAKAALFEELRMVGQMINETQSGSQVNPVDNGETETDYRDNGEVEQGKVIMGETAVGLSCSLLWPVLLIGSLLVIFTTGDLGKNCSLEDTCGIISIRLMPVFGIYVLMLTLLNLIWGLQSKHWPTAMGKIVESTVQGGGYYYPTVKYQYKVGDIKYESSNITRRPRLNITRGQSKEWAEEIVAEYAVGQAVIVYYKPEKPRVAVLTPGVSVTTVVIGLLVGFGLTIVGIMVVSGRIPVLCN